MSIFTRNKKKNPAQAKVAAKTGVETSPQRVGVVSSVLPTGSDPKEQTPFSDVVSNRFGPRSKQKMKPTKQEMKPTKQAMKPTKADAPTVAEPAKTSEPTDQTAAMKTETSALRTQSSAVETHTTESLTEPLSAVDSLFLEQHELETDPMANIGRATTITGNIVAEEDLEIHGTIEGSVQLAEHQVTVGEEGLVKASVEAQTVLVHGKITGDVTAMDLIEVKPGGIVGGDVKAPRVIMHDGAVIVGGLDMSAALPKSGTSQGNVDAQPDKKSEKKSQKESAKKGDRPQLKQVGLPPVHGADASA